MDKLAGLIGEKMGDMVEDAVLGVLGVGDKDDKEEDKGFFSKIFNKDDDEEERKKKKGGGFSFGGGQKDDDDGDKSFFSKIFNKDEDDEDGKEKSSGFQGMWREPGEAGSPGGGPERGPGGEQLSLSDGDLMNDLIDVAQETSTS